MAKPFGRTDFERAMRQGEIFSHPHYGKMTARSQVIDNLSLPTGQLVACDPSYIPYHSDIIPFTQTVKPGTYSASIAYADYLVDNIKESSLVSCICINFNSQTVVTWELATVLGQDVQTLSYGRRFGFGVDCGMACLLDEQTRKQIYGTPKYTSIASLLDRPWTKLTIDETSGANLIACTAGFGDGEYACYWGRDSKGKICCFIVDFEVLVEAIEAEAQFNIPELKEIEFHHPDLQRIGVRVRLIPQDPDGTNILFQIEGNEVTVIIRDVGTEYHSDHLTLYQYGNTFEYLFRLSQPLSPTATVTLHYFLGVQAL